MRIRKLTKSFLYILSHIHQHQILAKDISFSGVVLKNQTVYFDNMDNIYEKKPSIIRILQLCILIKVKQIIF